MRVYLAGPDVFLPDAAAIGTAKKAICARHDLTGVFPLDAIEDVASAAAPEHFMQIYWQNEAHIRSCDALIANLTPFRGPSADVGTIYELGLMRGLGRPVFGYTNAALPFRERTLRFLGDAAVRRAEDDWEDAEGLHLENFSLHDNLMIDGGIRACGGKVIARAVPEEDRWTDMAAFEECVAALAAKLRN
ncbi:nucleoside 2-deoxyribosyltransferase [Roseomonas marmotae]|uniref:Nucleoside 2-deoxyribosyltransferase n=1 Tax=Roseomonas marmotae TaxID=2768161 RepID=A0ABS3KHI7_9PROT|nr:nucleoside 2-deoxyribosyltransferase [Roseomonas marmotae]MBO1076457.1 nucleoside 2-deoxyribosyltransferase [Roseomonas marmotae]QTI77941.1 nucleoside 2-deoxyribosyltransferase [Roseomonas marmotae]